MPYIHRLHPNRPVIAALINSQFHGNITAAARAAGFASPATLHDIVKGRRDGRQETLEALAHALAVDVEVITVPAPDRKAA
jgi:hypothetical protein